MNTYFLSLLEEPRKRKGLCSLVKRYGICKFDQVTYVTTKECWFGVRFMDMKFFIFDLKLLQKWSVPDFEVAISYLSSQTFKKRKILIRTNLDVFRNIKVLLSF
jgi:hypothetical protein